MRHCHPISFLAALLPHPMPTRSNALQQLIVVSRPPFAHRQRYTLHSSLTFFFLFLYLAFLPTPLFFYVLLARRCTPTFYAFDFYCPGCNGVAINNNISYCPGAVLSSHSHQKFIKKYIGVSHVQKNQFRDVTNVSKALRAEFARGDGRVKRKEDERRKNIEPSDTLFVVNFHEETTRREDLEMLFNPFGELVRIDMKRNYAFVQFKTIEQATKAKETTNGGKLDQSVLTVEYVAQQRNDRDRPGRGGGGGGGRRHMDGDYNRGGRRSSSDRRHYDDRRGNSDSRGSGRRSPPLPSSSSHWRRSHSRSRSPPPGGRYAGSSGYRSR